MFGQNPVCSNCHWSERRIVYVPEFDPEGSGAVAVGVDIIEIARIQRVLDDFGERFLHRVYTERERERYRNRTSELAARFAAKEATSKALGTGIRGIRWREMEVLPNRRGKPVLILHGQAAARAAALGLTDFSVSLTHSRTDAMAFVVAVKARMAAETAKSETTQAIRFDAREDGNSS
ncbi:MAG: holo-[acyl-carrier protein] synthase [Thermomicrobiales bacterium]|jgi:holo-[acyl-carrier protein] synthase|nr:holo-[acyl-carrier protein] synthase [Thermomicrobiales bacterium]